METFLVNETKEDVWFDNFSVQSTTALIVQETHYDPWGVEMEGLGYQYGGIKENTWKFQGQENIDDHGLNWYSFKYRNYQPEIGRFFNIDPLADKYAFNSPYAFSENRVINGVELEGLEYAQYSYNESGMNAIRATAQQSREDKDAATSMKLDIIPVVGDGKGIVEFFTGKDLVTGEGLNWFNRAVGLVLLTELRLVDDVLESATIISKNASVGKQGEKIVTESLGNEVGEGMVVLEQISGKLEKGGRTQFDNVVVNKKTGEVEIVNETKTGNAGYSKNQSRYYEEGETATFTGKKARDAGIEGREVNKNNTESRTTRVRRQNE